MPKSKSFLQAVINPFKFHSKTEKEGDSLDTISAQEQKHFTFQTLVAATKDFHPTNKLGQGGFGPVFKGKLEDGREIAVKKLSQSSSQGKKEFLNEARLLMQVQHRNIVTLLGYCAYAAEKLLVYEYVANESLDKLLFKFGRQDEFDWNKRYATITGVARGLLYLHEDAHTCIIHRDIKASNILLDDRWIPKIADFGMARLYPEDETHVHTRVAGTSGYMAPEYVMHGNLSIKADVYSFGVLLLEIISGQKNSTFNLDPDCQSLLDWAYKFYKRDQTLEIVDKKLASSMVPDQAALCIQIGLLCTQSDPQLRPTMGRVVIMLSKKLGTLEVPTRPGYLGARYRRSHRGNTSSSTAGISVESSSQSSGSTNNTNTASASALSATATASTSTNYRLRNPRGGV
ncbi:Protein kinase domain-containing protein [Heracleum sosnowskyi]|uniref:Protein kinase domain-containing protein n=1 Tax=Heracleum sosnowskyi TaxID=360622 RepID=A0AAD8MJ71_9APIA|nr:Protein kinase domain-containing protein [Heracleum sosnowskyi]